MKKKLHVLVLFYFLFSCTLSKKERAEQLFNSQCASCHIAPSPKDLPKKLCKESIFPDMAARMGIKEANYSPYKDFDFIEQEAILKTGIYNVKPTISLEDWVLLKDYIIASAREKLASVEYRAINKDELAFSLRVVNVDSIPGTYITSLKIDSENETVITGDLAGNILKHNYPKVVN